MHKHGMRRSPEYSVWIAMRRRCLAPRDKDYPQYGGRGITICAEWDDFAAFYRDMGPRPAGTTIDRIDVSGNYEPGNCRWADRRTQQNNRTYTTFVETAKGRMPMADVARALGISVGAAHMRNSRGKLDVAGI